MPFPTRNPEAEQMDGEEGYLLLTVLVMVFLMLLWLSVAAPRVAKQIQRDKEREAVQRGLQYRRALQLYYKKFGSYPTDIKQLENTNQIRYLRRRYTDPMTGKDDWRIIHIGEAKVPPMGFFGQPLQAGQSSVSTGVGLGIGGGGASIYSGGATGAGSTGDPGSTTGTAGGSSNSPGSSSFGFSNSGPSSGIGGSGSGFGSSTGGVGSSPTGTSGPGSSSPGSSSFGGGPIVGVGIPLKKDSILEYHKQKKYSLWEFVYDPQQDLVTSGGGITNGGNTSGSGTNNNPAGTGPNSGSGSPFGFGNSGSGSSNGFGFGNSGSGNSGSSGGFGNSGSGSGSTGGTGSSTPNNPQQ